MIWSMSPSWIGSREKPAMATAPMTSSAGVSTSRASISIRGRMMSRTVWSPSRKARPASTCSAGSNRPWCAPVWIRRSMSSMETVFSRSLRRPNSQSTVVEATCTARINPAIISNSKEIGMGRRRWTGVRQANHVLMVGPMYLFYPFHAAYLHQRMPNFMMMGPFNHNGRPRFSNRFARRMGWLGAFARLTMTLHSSPMGRGGHRDDRRRQLLSEDLAANSARPAKAFPKPRRTMVSRQLINQRTTAMPSSCKHNFG